MDAVNSNDQLSPRSMDEWTIIEDEPTQDTRLLTTSTSSKLLSPSVSDLQYFGTTSDNESNPSPQQHDQASETCSTKAAATQTIEIASMVPSTTTVASESDNDVPLGYYRIRLRIGESVRHAHFKAIEIVEDFTAQFFVDELASGKHVRLIYMGMLLIRDRTMGEYGIEEDGVIHAVITTAIPSSHEEAREVEIKGLSNPANSLLAITGLFLYGLWTLLYHYPHLFSWKAIMLLTALSLVHISTTVSRVAA